MITARFSYWNDFDGEQWPSYMITQSDDARARVGSNCGPDEVAAFSMVITDRTPTFAEWVAAGKPVYRGDDLKETQ